MLLALKEVGPLAAAVDASAISFQVSASAHVARNAQKEFLIGQSSRSHATYISPTISGWLLVHYPDENSRSVIMLLSVVVSATSSGGFLV